MELRILTNFGEFEATATRDTTPVPTYVKFLPDTKVAAWGYKCRSLFLPKDKLKNNEGYPQMVPLRNRVGCNLTEAWQWFWVKQQMLIVFGHMNWEALSTVNQENMKRWWNNMTQSWRFITNGTGTEIESGRRNYISRWNLGGEYPKIQQVVCATNAAKLLETSPVTFGGVKWYKIETLDGNKPPPDPKKVNYLTRPDLIHVAVTWAFNDRTEIFRLEDFPQMVNTFGYNRPSLYPLVSAGGFDYIEAARVSIIKPGEKYPPNHYEM